MNTVDNVLTCVLKFLQDLVISRLNVLLGVGTKNKLWGD